MLNIEKRFIVDSSDDGNYQISPDNSSIISDITFFNTVAIAFSCDQFLVKFKISIKIFRMGKFYDDINAVFSRITQNFGSMQGCPLDNVGSIVKSAIPNSRSLKLWPGISLHFL